MDNKKKKSVLSKVVKEAAKEKEPIKQEAREKNMEKDDDDKGALKGFAKLAKK